MKKLDLNLLQKNIDAIAEYDFSNNKVFGSAYFVYQDGCEVFQKCYGKDGLNGNLVTNTTLFRLASMTKPVTAVATLVLVDKGLISLDDCVSKYIPKFEEIEIIDADGKNLGKPKNKPTIRNILGHCSGICAEPKKMCKITGEEKKTFDGTIEFLIKAGLDCEPTTMEMYNAYGAFDVLSKIIEIVSGTDYLSFLKSEIFEPCNMRDTTFIPSEEQYNRIIKMHTQIDGKNAEFEMPQGCIFEDIPWTHFLGGAGLISTLHDYNNFSKMLCNKGEGENARVISEELCDLMIKPQIKCGEYQHWGLAVRVITDSDYPNLPMGAFGWSGAYGSHFWIDPHNKIAAVFMKNSKFDGGAGNESAVKFEKAVYDSLK